MENIKDTRICFEKRHSRRNGATPNGDKCDCLPGYVEDNCELGPMRDRTTKWYSHADNFKVKDEKSLYQFTFDSVRTSSNPVGDCLSDLRGANFSTYDSDNDGGSSVNYASRHSGGWWFRDNTCSTCNPTGQLLQPVNGLRTGVDSEVFWIKDLGNIAPYRISIRLKPQ